MQKYSFPFYNLTIDRLTLKVILAVERQSTQRVVVVGQRDVFMLLKSHFFLKQNVVFATDSVDWYSDQWHFITFLNKIYMSLLFLKTKQKIGQNQLLSQHHKF